MDKNVKQKPAETVRLPRLAAKKIFELTGDHYLRSIAEIIVRDMDLGLDYAFVGELTGEKRIKTTALYAHDRFIENIEYDLENTPCNFVAGKQLCIYPRNVQRLFPKDAVLPDFGAESYMGIPLFSSTGQPLGLIAALGTKAIPEDRQEEITALLQIFGARAAAELERKKTEQALKRSAENYRSIFDAANDAIFIHDVKTGAILEVNPKTAEMYGYSVDEVVGIDPEAMSAGTPGYGRKEAMQWIRHAAEGTPQVFEWLAKNKKGELFWVEINLKRADVGGQQRILAIVRDITGRKAAEERLKQLSQLHQLILEAAGEGIFGLDRLGNFIFMNKAAAAMLGFTPEECIGRHSSTCMPYVRWADGTCYPEKECKTYAPFEEGKARHVEDECFCRRDGTRFPVEYTSTPIVADGRILGSVVTFSDITARRRAEEALRTSESNYREIFESVNDAIFVHDIDTGDVISSNRKTSEMFGYSQEEFRIFLSESLFSGIPGYTTQDALKWIRRAAEGPPQLFEWQSRRKNGQLFWVEVNLKRAVIGGETRLLAIVREITERKQAEQKLQESEERFRQLAENTNQVFWFMTPDPERIHYVNPAFEAIWGYLAEDLYRDPRLWVQAIHPEDRDRVDQAFNDWAAGKAASFDMDYRIVRQDGGVRWIRDRGTMVRDAEGRIVRLSGIADDITERKEIEQEVQKAKALLEEAQRISGIGNWEWDVQTNKLTLSDEVCRIFNMPREESKRSFEVIMEMVHPEDRPALDKSITEAANKRKENSVNEFRIIRKDGDIRILHARSLFQYSSAGAVIGMRGTTQDVTEVRQAEEELKLTQFSVDHASISVFLVDRTARILYVNEQACRVLGYAREELLAMKIFDLDPNVGVSSWNARWVELKEGNRLHFETLHRKKDGGVIPVEITSNYIAFGGREYNWAFAQDISERKKVEEELIRINRQNELILESAGDGIIGMNAEGNHIFMNSAAVNLLGYSSEKLMGEHSHSIWHHTKADGSPFPESECRIYQTRWDGNSRHVDDEVFWKKDGTNFPVEYVTTPIREGDAIVGTVVSFKDVSERKRAEAALLESEERFRTLADNIAQLAWMTDGNGRIFWYNKRWFDYTGTTLEEMQGWGWQKVHHPDHVNRVVKKMSHCFETGEFWEDTFPLQSKEGEYKWFLSRAIPIRNAEGKIVRWFGTNTDITDRMRMEEEIRHMAQHDALTGLPNRRLFIDILQVELAEARRHRTKLAVLFLDLDHFKEINDTLGHDVGDHLLKEVAERFRKTTRESDTVARIGGDEFNMILADVNRIEDVSDIAVKIVNSLREPIVINGHELHVTTSVGISMYPDDSNDIEMLIRYADSAMYHAKESGRNTFRFSDPSINVKTIERMKLERWLRQTIRRGELAVLYQPQIDIKSNKISYAEALVRWNHPQRGLLEPRDFIPLAEETGFITSIDEWVLRTVCSQAAAWRKAGLESFCVTVNVSSRRFQSPGFVNMLSAILTETELPPGCLDLDMAESTAMDDVRQSASQLRELRELGVHISIHNFGTGCSSLNYLKKLPIERLKIDQSFIHDIATDSDDRAIIGAVTSMAHKMGIRTVAEGVETEEQLAFLRDSECDGAQGYLFSRPMPAERFRELVEAGK